MKAANLNDLVVHYRDDGPKDGPALVLSNSLGTDLRIWEDMIPHFPRHRIIRYDTRGHGLSQVGTDPFSMGDLVGDAAALLDHLGLRDVVFVGLSIGGQIAQGLAAERPDLVAGLVLADTAAKIGTEETWEARIRDIKTNGLDAMSDGILERWFSRGYLKGKVHEVEVWRAMLTRTTQAGYQGCCHAIAHTDLIASTAGLTVPTLVLVGRDDGATPPDLVRETAALIDGAAFEIIPKAGHLPCIEQPAVMAGLISNFLKAHELG